MMDPRAIACRIDPSTRSPFAVCLARFALRINEPPIIFPVGKYVIDTGASVTIIGSDSFPFRFNYQNFLSVARVQGECDLDGFDGITRKCPLVDVTLSMRGLDGVSYAVTTYAAMADHFAHSVIGTNTLEMANFRLCLANDTVELDLLQYIAELGTTD